MDEVGCEDGAGWTFHQNRLHFAHQRQGQEQSASWKQSKTSQVGAPIHPLCVDAAVVKYQPVVPPLPGLQRSRRQAPTPWHLPRMHLRCTITCTCGYVHFGHFLRS